MKPHTLHTRALVLLAGSALWAGGLVATLAPSAVHAQPAGAPLVQGLPAFPALVDLVALDDALAELAALDERKHRIVELRYFGGLTVEQIAEVLDLGPRTVDRDWRCARPWLFAALGSGESDGAASSDRDNA